MCFECHVLKRKEKCHRKMLQKNRPGKERVGNQRYFYSR